MSLSWDDDDVSSDDAGWRARLGAWFAPSPAELAGLAVLVIGALLLSGVLWLQAGARPTSIDPSAAGSGPGGDVEVGDDEVGAGAGEIGASIDATGTADGAAPGIDDGQPVPGDGEAGDGVAGQADARDGGTGDGGTGHAGAEAGGTVVVHVTGAVRTAGVVTLPTGARIGDAVVAAGGARTDALVERVNLARLVADGEHVHVPAQGDDPATLPPIGGGVSPGGGSAAGAGDGAGGAVDGAGGAGPVHLNRASAAELETLPGIGPARAEAIITHREQQGPFTAPGDLRAVSGIGEATFQRLAPLITVE